MAVQQQKNEWQIQKLGDILTDVLDMISDYEKMIAKIDIDEKEMKKNQE